MKSVAGGGASVVVVVVVVGRRGGRSRGWRCGGRGRDGRAGRRAGGQVVGLALGDGRRRGRRIGPRWSVRCRRGPSSVGSASSVSRVADHGLVGVGGRLDDRRVDHVDRRRFGVAAERHRAEDRNRTDGGRSHMPCGRCASGRLGPARPRVDRCRRPGRRDAACPARACRSSFSFIVRSRSSGDLVQRGGVVGEEAGGAPPCRDARVCGPIRSRCRGCRRSPTRSGRRSGAGPGTPAGGLRGDAEPSPHGPECRCEARCAPPRRRRAGDPDGFGRTTPRCRARPRARLRHGRAQVGGDLARIGDPVTGAVELHEGLVDEILGHAPPRGRRTMRSGRGRCGGPRRARGPRRDAQRGAHGGSDACSAPARGSDRWSPTLSDARTRPDL